MTIEEYNIMYKKLYSLFDGTTPLKKDCGLVCAEECCKGDDKTGMLLFPFEETELKVIQQNGLRYAVCPGECDREKRPLACRIFPFFPSVDENGRIRVIADIRGYDVCPLVRHSEEVLFDRRFLKNVKKAGKILSKNPECKEFLLEITKEINEISEFKNKIEL